MEIDDQQTKTSITLDTNELATVLAALRLFQREFEDRNAFDIRESLPDHFADGIMPLGTADIDTLCEKINTPARDGTEDLSTEAKAIDTAAAADAQAEAEARHYEEEGEAKAHLPGSWG